MGRGKEGKRKGRGGGEKRTGGGKRRKVEEEREGKGGLPPVLRGDHRP